MLHRNSKKRVNKVGIHSKKRPNYTRAQRGRTKECASLVHKNTTTRDIFNTWLEEYLLPEVGRGKMKVMDNLVSIRIRERKRY
jgi:hypothetical protein